MIGRTTQSLQIWVGLGWLRLRMRLCLCDCACTHITCTISYTRKHTNLVLTTARRMRIALYMSVSLFVVCPSIPRAL